MLKSHFSKAVLENFYKSGRSMQGISHQLNCSIHKVVYWMDKYGIKRRSLSEAIYLNANPDGDPFKIKLKLSLRDRFLFGLGIGIYLGEGNKMSKTSLRVANTDSRILKIVIKFLIKICGLKKHRISYSIVCFNDVDPSIARDYWAKQLEVLPEKFGKITIIPHQGKGTYRRKSRFGVCTVSANNVKLRNWFIDQMEIINI